MELRPFRIEHFYARHEFSAKYMLSSSDSESRSLREILALEEGAEAAFLEQRFGYTESPGSPALREAIGFPRVVGTGERAAPLCDRVLQATGVLLLPGDVFDEPDHFRVGFGRANMPEALARLDAFLG